MSNASKKLALFKRGVVAARAVFGPGGIYVCPICGDGFDRAALDDGELTLEHVPPRALGGKGIILTCANCNSTAGHSIDAAIVRRSDLNRFMEVFLQKSEGAAGRAILQIGGTPINVEVHHDNETTTFRVLSDSNDPSSINRTAAYLKDLAQQGKGEGETFKITANARYHGRLARVGDLRCAFLACTAAFGYRFAFSSVLDPVRNQIREPEKELLPRWWVHAPTEKAFQIGVSELNGLVVVTYNRHAIMLPWPSRDDSIYWQISESLAKGETINLTAKDIAWPTFFHALLDVENA